MSAEVVTKQPTARPITVLDHLQKEMYQQNTANAVEVSQFSSLPKVPLTSVVSSPILFVSRYFSLTPMTGSKFLLYARLRDLSHVCDIMFVFWPYV